MHSLTSLRVLPVIGLDDDDPELEAYRSGLTDETRPRLVNIGQRRPFATWVNDLWELSRDLGAPYTAQLNDDHLVLTEGWDEQLISAIERLPGPGMSYPDDKRRADIPEVIVMHRAVPEALGWVCEPRLEHFCVDMVWAKLGQASGRLVYVPEVVIEHQHYLTEAGRAAGAFRDQTYADAEAQSHARDHELYQAWETDRFPTDLARLMATTW